MKRSEINILIHQADECFKICGWTLPPNPRWDVTDFGLGNWQSFGLVLVNLAEEREYCEKLMYARKGMTTPAHTHKKKKEDIICRWGLLEILLWANPMQHDSESITVKINGNPREVSCGKPLQLHSGERITLVPGVYHEFSSASGECIIGEVSTANDDTNDNFFINPDIGRYPYIDEDEPAYLRLLSEPA